MAEALPTLEIGQPSLPSNKSSPSSANLTARLYEVGAENQVVHLPEVQPKSSRLKIKGNILSKDRLQKPKKSTAFEVAHPTEENVYFSDSDSDSSCSSSSSSESRCPGAYLNSEKTETDQLRRFSFSNATRSSSQETINDSPPMFASASLPSFLSSAASGESRSVKKMKHHVASNLLRHNHHILLHRGQNALNSHIQITVNAKAANEIAAHAVVTEVPALLPIHRQRAHLAALAGQRSPIGMPPASPKGLSVTIPGGHAASPSNRNIMGLKSPPVSPRGTALLSPLHAHQTKSPHAVKERNSASSSPHNIPSIPEAK